SWRLLPRCSLGCACLPKTVKVARCSADPLNLCVSPLVLWQVPPAPEPAHDRHACPPPPPRAGVCLPARDLGACPCSARGETRRRSAGALFARRLGRGAAGRPG